jgi:hypothetical protein
MMERATRAAWLVVVVCVLWAVPRGATGATPEQPSRPEAAPGLTEGPVRARPEMSLGVPLHQVAPQHREHVRHVLEQPTLTAHGPMEIFACRPEVYRWFLDHPDQAVPLWRRLGARCMDITDQGDGRFGWADTHGSQVHWQTVCDEPRLRIWYAEGSVRPGPLLPLVPARAVVVLRHVEGHGLDGRTLVRHQADMYVQTDSKTAALATRLLGPAAPRLADQCLSQMEMFFSALAWYFDHYPERAGRLIAGALPADSPASRELRSLLASAARS